MYILSKKKQVGSRQRQVASFGLIWFAKNMTMQN